MKKIVLLTIFACLSVLIFGATARVYMQKLTLTDGTMPGNPANTNPIPDYNLTVFLSSDPTTVLQTVTATNPANICLKRSGTSPNFYVVAYLNQSIFPNNWLPAGNVNADGRYLDMTVTYIPTGETLHWTKVVVDGTSPMTDLTTPLIAPPYPVISNTLEVTSNYAGATIYLDGVTTGQVTPYTFDPAVAGIYTVMKDNVDSWLPMGGYNYDGDGEESVHFVGTMVPGPAMPVYPTDGQEIHIAWDADPTTYELSWLAPVDMPVSGYFLIWNGGAQIDLGVATSWTTPAIAEGAYTWQVIPYVTDPAKGAKTKVAPVKTKVTANSVKGISTTSVAWDFTIVRDAASNYTIAISSDWDATLAPNGSEIFFNGVTTGFMTPHTFTYTAATWPVGSFSLANIVFGEMTVVWGSDWAVPAVPANTSHMFESTAIVIGSIAFDGDGYSGHTGVFGDLPAGAPLGQDTGIPATIIILQGSSLVPQDVTCTVPAAGWFVWWHDVNGWHMGDAFPSIGTTVVLHNVVFGAKGDVTVIVNDNPTLPVELSSFTAVLTQELFVNLTWVTESETQVLGFNVYRSEDNNFTNAVRVNPAIIGAHNTSEQNVYSITDTEVDVNHTYYYWLENVDMGGGNDLHGPQTVTVTGNPVPVLPEVTVLNNVYPNPFRSGTSANISVSVKAGETGSVTVYNILGQAVKTFKVTEGNRILKWDSKGCGSGIYFVKLSTPTTNSTKKMVIVK